ncbi:Fc receptor-like protein 5 [Acipenser oxyrinchus oxyrinchus]|uniref:Fc receptor-like protein 5 n=1 Tax=Acipenser oxyrinchus oxyrinchus TaxID=40147 RepID=A0AAD8CRC8_ACIOX|nr:Fc receptor-like protein 5 [Acipenser oxyrinchus oxyrinchus]
MPFIPHNCERHSLTPPLSQKSWSWIIAALSVSLVLIIFIPVTLLLFYRYKTKGFLFIAAKSRRPADQTPAQPSRGTELSGLGQEPGNSTASNLESVYAEVKPNQQNKGQGLWNSSLSHPT